METCILKGYKNKDLQLYIWKDVSSPKGVLQLVHGSCEHSLRYNDFAKYLNSIGWIVIANDHRGHGKTANVEDNELGYFSDDEGWNIIIEDLKYVNNYIKSNYANLDIVMFGHSMGSFMSRTFIIKYPTLLEGVILSGTGWQNNFLLNIAIRLAKRNQKKYGSKNIDKKIWNLSYKKLNKRYSKSNSNGVEWLSSVEDVQSNFLNDPLCGQIFTSSAFRDMFEGIKFIQNKTNISKVSKNLPILLLSGKDDPVGNYTKSVNKTYKVFINNSLKVEMKLYDKMRHEILNEVNKEQVYEDINNFLSKIKNTSLK